jgi:iron complex transport system substrate-binding protein
MLAALGVAPLAVSHECDFPPLARSLPRATFSRIESQRSASEIDGQVKGLLEAGEPLYGLHAQLVAKLRPDVIVTQAQCDVCAVRHADVLDLVASCPELSATCVVSLNPQSLGEVLQDIARIGVAVEREARARRVVAALRTRIDSVKAKTQPLAAEARPRTVVIEWTSPLMAAGNWTPELVALAGGQNCLSVAGHHSQYVTWEAILAATPEVLLIAPCGFALERSLAEAAVLLRQPGWADLPAARSDRVFVIDGNQYLNRSGPRLVDTLEILAHLLQPRLFPPPALAEAFRKVP